MHRRKLWLFAGVVLAALALAATGAARVNGPDSASSNKAGTLVFGAEQGGGPDWCLNLILDVDCNAFWNVVFQTPVIRGAFLFTPKFTYQPDLITSAQLRSKVDRNKESLTFTATPLGTGHRIALDRDRDGDLDGNDCDDESD